MFGLFLFFIYFCAELPYEPKKENSIVFFRIAFFKLLRKYFFISSYTYYLWSDYCSFPFTYKFASRPE